MAAQTPLDPDLASAVVGLCELYLRPVFSVLGYPAPTRTPVFAPELTSAEQATYDEIVRMAKSHISGLSLGEFQSIEPDITTVRAFRTRTTAQWTAMTQTQRDAAIIDGVNSLIDILRALLRDS